MIDVLICRMAFFWRAHGTAHSADNSHSQYCRTEISYGVGAGALSVDGRAACPSLWGLRLQGGRASPFSPPPLTSFSPPFVSLAQQVLSCHSPGFSATVFVTLDKQFHLVALAFLSVQSRSELSPRASCLALRPERSAPWGPDPWRVSPVDTVCSPLEGRGEGALDKAERGVSVSKQLWELPRDRDSLSRGGGTSWVMLHQEGDLDLDAQMGSCQSTLSRRNSFRWKDRTLPHSGGIKSVCSVWGMLDAVAWR